MRPGRGLGVLFGAFIVAAAPAWAQMPDVRQMSGVPMQVGDVQTGTVVVRVVGATVTDNIVGQAVELQVGDKTLTVKTDANGHAQFDGLVAGGMARASTLIDGSRVDSQPFQVPASGGIRVILAAGASGGASAAPTGAAQMAPVAGEIFLGGDSRIQIEFDDDSVTVFYILYIVNGGAAAVSPKSEVTFDLPDGAEQPTVLEGSSTQATLRGRRVSVAGPFAPGSTPVQIAFGLPPAGPERVIAQTLPLAWGRVQVIATKLPGLSMTSPQFASTVEQPGDTHNFLLGSGAVLGSGKELSVTLAGLPSRNRTGRFLAIALAFLVLGGGFWGAVTATARTGDLARKAELEGRRAKLLADLVTLEQQQQTGGVNPARYASRRAELFDQLERVYGELDQHAAVPGEGLVA